MKRNFLALILLGLFLFGMIGCSEDNDEQDVIEPIAYVLNGLSATISVINSDLTVANDVVTLGTYPNDFILDKNLQKMYVVNSGDNNVQIIDLENMSTQGNIDTGVGTNPYSIALVDNDMALVSNLFTNTLLLLDMNDKSVVDTIPVGSAPEGIAYREGFAYVANSVYGFGAGTISVVDVANKVVVDTIEVGINPQSVFFDSQGELNAICTGDYGETRGEIYVVNVDTRTVKTNFPIGGYPNYYALGEDGVAYVTAAGGWPEGEPGYLMSFDTINEAPLHPESDPILQEDNIFGMAIYSNGKIWACNFGEGQIYEIEPTNGEILQKINVGDGPQVIKFVE